MRKFLFLLILTIIVCFRSEAVNNLIQVHREWADSKFARPEKMKEEELLWHASLIVAHDLQEDSSRGVLEALQPRIPALSQYLELVRPGGEDPGLSITYAALEGIAKYASEKYPNSLTAWHTGYIQLASVAGVRYLRPELTEFIAGMEKKVNSKSDRELRAILCDARILQALNNIYYSEWEDPALYPEIFRIEKEALDIYPMDSDVVSFYRADLYASLGMLKSSIVNDFNGAVEHMYSGHIPEMQYVMIGDNNYYPCNSPAYFIKAAEIGSQVLNPGHPRIYDMVMQEVFFRLGYLAGKSKLRDERDAYISYLSDYYPYGSFILAEAKLNNLNYNINFGIPDSNEFFIERDLELMERILGADNPGYLNRVMNICYAEIYQNPTSTLWIDRYMEACAKAGYEEDSDRVQAFKLQVYSFLYNIIGERAYMELDKIANYYRDNHKPTLLSIQMGYDLSNYAFNISNHSAAHDILDIALADLESLIQKDERYRLLKWNYKLAQAQSACLADPSGTDFIYLNLMGELEKESFPCKEFVNYFAVRNWTNSKNYNVDFEGACRMASECVKISEGLPSFQIHDIGMEAFFAVKAGIQDEKIDRHVENAMQMLRDMMNDGYYRQIDFSSPDYLALYLFTAGRLDEAIYVKESQIQMYDCLYAMQESPAYITMKQNLANLYESAQRLNDATRLRSEAAEIAARTFGFSPSPAYLDYLWEDYYYAKPTIMSDSWNVSSKLVQIGQATGTLYQASNQDPNIYFSYVARFAAEYIHLATFFYGFIEDMDNHIDEATEEALEMVKQYRANLDLEYPQAVAMAQDIYDNFPKYSYDYKENTYYQELANGLARHYAFQKDTITALSIREDLMDGLHDPRARFAAAGNLANDFLQLDRLDDAEKYVLMAEEIYPSLTNASDQDRQTINALRFFLSVRQGRYQEAVPLARERFSYNKSVLDGNFQLMTPAEQTNYLNSMGDPASPYTTLLQYLPDQLSGETYDALVYRTGMQLRSQNATKDAIRRSDDPRVPAMLDSLTQIYSRLNSLDINSINTDQEVYGQLRMEYASLSNRANRIERELLDLTAHLRENSLSDVKWQQVRDRLDPDEAAIEFLFASDCVMALVIRKNSTSPKAIALTETEPFFELLNVKGTNNSAALARHLYDNCGETLYEMLWQPLESELVGIGTIYFSAPGSLSNIAFNAFSTPDGRRLFDLYDLVQLTTTAQLVFDHEAKRPQTIAMMGDILYSPQQKPREISDPGVRDIDMDFNFDITDDDDVRKVNYSCFRHLPYTALEIEAISALFPENAVDSVRRLNATEECLHAMIERHPDILHLATHGYYVEGKNEKISRYPFFSKKGMGPMQRSGIALCNAENTWKGISDLPDDSDGIVTAAEVAEFNLKDTGLVALSACETALGDFSFEGVFGLQRGFKQAGVQTLLVSLWSVNDESTSMFMTRFYESLLQGDSRQQSWRNAVETVRESFPSPFYWAPFILLDGI